jgi:CheY-like chemotaxis protein
MVKSAIRKGGLGNTERSSLFPAAPHSAGAAFSEEVAPFPASDPEWRPSSGSVDGHGGRLLNQRELMDGHQDQSSMSEMPDRICLIVDDEPSIRAYLRAILQRERIQSLEADNAAQALSIIHKLGGRLDLIVSDIKMPGEMDGIDLAYSVRNSFPALPVLLISGYGDVESVKQAAANFEFIQKPFVPETILMAVNKVVGSVDAKASDGPNADEGVL